jgi:concanavalin A-like lectin/glucanase superfamily protein
MKTLLRHFIIGHGRRLSVSALVAAMASVCSAAVHPNGAESVPAWSPNEIGPHSRSWRIASDDAPRARAQSNAGTANQSDTVRRVVEIATGMNYWDGEQWTPSDPTFEVTDDGFVAARVQHPVHLVSNLNQIGAVKVRTPDGIMLHSTPVGIGLYDAASGASAIIGVVQDCTGVLVDSGRVVYEDAFRGVCADVVYTIDRGTFEQDVVITGRLDPADYGFPTNTTRIRIFSEFYDAPHPERMRRPIRVEQRLAVRNRMVSPDFVDEVLDFGEFVLATGRAYTATKTANSGDPAAPVAKEYTTIAGRTFLIESVEYESVQGELQLLPDCATESASNGEMPKTSGPKVRYAELPTPPAAARARVASSGTATRMATASVGKRAGVVIDYIATIGPGFTTPSVFQGDTTYMVSGAVFCSGPTTIEGGAVFKYKYLSSPSTAYIKLNSSSSITCKTSSYRPAIFTAVDDDSVGDSMNGYSGSGYTGSINANYYANPALWISFLSSSTLTNLHFRYAQEAIHVEAGGAAISTIGHVQLVNCIRGIRITGSGSGCGVTVTVNNSLMASVQYPFTFTSSGISTSANCYNCTIDGYLPLGGTSRLLTASPSATASFRNSIIANVNTLVSGSVSTSGSSFNGFYNCGFTSFGSSQVSPSGPPFQSQGAGNYYLAAGHSFRNAGTTVPNPLSNELKKKTTLPPIELSVVISSDTILSPQALRDVDVLDLGYHYDALDYAVSGLAVESATLVLTNGVAMGAYGDSGIWLKDGARLVSEGTPLNRNHISRYNTVQEQPVILATGSVNNNVSINPYNMGASPPVLECRFTEFDGSVAGGYHLYTGNASWTLDSLILRDCCFNGASAVFAGPLNSTLALNNNSFERVSVQFLSYPQMTCYNNLFNGGSVYFQRATGAGTWVVKDNSFDGCLITDFGDPLTHGYNGYINTANRLLPNDPNDKVLTGLTYSIGALGRYYQPTSSPLINGGSRTADWSGLYHHTVTTAQTKEANTTVDIGFHYVALSGSTPADTDGDGAADYLEDRNGNNVQDTGETSLSDADNDYDGRSDAQESADGTDPLDANSVLSARLGYWRFNTSNWSGEQGQLPKEYFNVQAITSWSGNALQVNSASAANLKYRDAEANGAANINCRKGSVRFWFMPSWSSGPGPGTTARLIEMGDGISSDGWWALSLNSIGTQISFASRASGGSTTTYYSVPISWNANEWHQIVLTYDSTATILYVDAQQVASGAGVVNYPGVTTRASHGVSVGSNRLGNEQSKGQFEELETFNYPLSASDVSQNYERIQSPQSNFLIVVTNKYTKGLSVAASIVGGPAAYMAIVTDGNRTTPTWTIFSEALTASLPSGDGTKDVWVGLKGLGGDTTIQWVKTQIILDTALPTLTITSPTETQFSQPLVQIVGSSADALASVSYDIVNANGAVIGQPGFISSRTFDTALQRYTASTFHCPDVRLALGANSITLRASDFAGNVSSLSLNYTLSSSGDTTAPMISVEWPQSGAKLSGGSFTLRGNLDDVGAQIVVTGPDQYKYDGRVDRTGLFHVEGISLIGGVNQFTVEATDIANNVRNLILSVEKVPVQLTIGSITFNPSSWTAPEDKLNVSGTIDASNQQVWVNGVQAVVNGSSWSISNLPISRIGPVSISVDSYPVSAGSPPTGAPTASVSDNVERPPSLRMASWVDSSHYERTDVINYNPPLVRWWQYDSEWITGSGGTEDGQRFNYYDDGLCTSHLAFDANNQRTACSGTGPCDLFCPPEMGQPLQHAAIADTQFVLIDGANDEFQSIGQSTVELFTGGKPGGKDKILLVLSTSSGEDTRHTDEFFPWTTDIPAKEMQLMGELLYEVPGDPYTGYLFKVFPENIIVDATPTANRDWYDFTVGVNKMDMLIYRDEACTQILDDWRAETGRIRSPKWLLQSEDNIYIRVTGAPAGFGNSFFTVHVSSESSPGGVIVYLDEVLPGVYQNTAARGELLRLSTITQENAVADLVAIVDEEVFTFKLRIKGKPIGYEKDVMVDRAEYASCGINIFYGSSTGDRNTVRTEAFTNSKFFDNGDGNYPDNVVSIGNPMRTFIKNAGANASHSGEADWLHISSHGLPNGNLQDDFGGIIIDPDSSTGIQNGSDWNNDVEWTLIAACSELNQLGGGRAAWQTSLFGNPRNAHGVLGAYKPVAGDLRVQISAFWNRTRGGVQSVVAAYAYAMEFDGPPQPWAYLHHQGAGNDTMYFITRDTSGSGSLTFSYFDANIFCGRVDACCGEEPIKEIIDGGKGLVRKGVSALPSEKRNWVPRPALLAVLARDRRNVQGFRKMPSINPKRAEYLSDSTLDEISNLSVNQANALANQFVYQEFPELASRLRIKETIPRIGGLLEANGTILQTNVIGYLVHYEVLVDGTPVWNDHVKISISGNRVCALSVQSHEPSSSTALPSAVSSILEFDDALAKSLDEVKRDLSIKGDYEILDADLHYINHADIGDGMKDEFVLAWHVVINRDYQGSGSTRKIFDVWLNAATGNYLGKKLY